MAEIVARRLVDHLERSGLAGEKPTSDDGARPISKSSNQGDRQPDVDQIEELRRLIGEADGDAPRSCNEADRCTSRSLARPLIGIPAPRCGTKCGTAERSTL
jgi:hypothetical protein